MNNIYKIKNQDVPDHYGMTVFFIDGKKKEFFAVGHTLVTGNSILSLRTKEDKVHWLPISNIFEIEYDLNFSKILEAKEAKAREEAAV